VIRVPIPIDVGTVATTASSAFALATPIRIERLLELAIVQVGARAPSDRRERELRTARAGMRDGDFIVEIDGRSYARLDNVAVCAGTVTLRFFATESGRRRRLAR